MQRYLITRTLKQGNAHTERAALSATNRTMALAIFEDQKRLAAPGETVNWLDTKAKNGTTFAHGDALVRTFTAPTAADIAAAIAHDYERLLGKLDTIVSDCSARIDKFIAGLRESLDGEKGYDVARQFEWVHTEAEAAARLVVAAETVGMLRDGKTVIETQAHAREQVLRGARYPSWTTSPASNMMHTYRTQAWAEMVETLSWHMQITEVRAAQVKEVA